MAGSGSRVPDDLLPVIHEDLRVGASLCRERIAHDHARYRRNLRRRIAEGYLIATMMRADYALWTEFLEDPFFNDDWEIRSLTKKNFRPAVLQAVMYWLFNAGLLDAAKRNKVWKYARAVETYIEDDVPAEKVAEKIAQDKGIEALCRKAAKENPKQSPHKDWQERIGKDVPQLGPRRPKFVLVSVDDDEYDNLWGAAYGDFHDARLESAGRNEEGIPMLRLVEIETL